MSTETLEILSRGVQGPAGLVWNDDGWSSGVDFTTNTAIEHNGTSYRATAPHTSAAATEPGEGASWETVWAVVAQRGDLTDQLDAAEASATAAAASATAAAGSAAAAATSETNAADSESAAAASASAAATSESNASDSETAAASSASAASTSAANAATSEANTASSASAAATSETNAAASATAASLSEDNAETFASQADTSRQLAQTAQAAAETAETGAEQAYAAAQTLVSNIDGYDETAGLLNAVTKETLASASVLSNRLYLAGMDSDGGAWRKKVRWLTIPLSMSIVTLAGSVSLYNEDKSAVTLIKSWTTSGATVARAMNGRIVYGSASGVYVIDLITDEVWRYSTAGLAKANQRAQEYNQTTATFTVVDAAKALPSNTVSDVALTVGAGTPIDEVRKVPNPTVSCGTGSGAGVIHWDGRVCNSSWSLSIEFVRFGLEHLYMARAGGTPVQRVPLSRLGVASFDADASWNIAGTIPALVGQQTRSLTKAAGKTLPHGSSLGLSLLQNESVASKSSVAHITNAYNTGYMVGDIKLALAASTADVTNLVEATPLNEDGSSATGWSDARSNGTISVSSGNVRSTVTDHTAGGGAFGPVKAISGLTIGKRYGYYAAASRGTTSVATLRIGPQSTLSSGNAVETSIAASPTVSLQSSFVATAETMYAGVIGVASAAGQYVEIDSFAIRAVAEDRSVAGNHPVVKGTVTRAAVASGSELACFTGFSDSNYFEWPYISAFDYGTGDFDIPFGFRLSSASGNQTIYERCDAGLTGGGVRIRLNSSGQLVASTTTDGFATAATATTTATYADNRFYRGRVVRRSGTLEIWVERERIATVASAHNVSNASAIARAGRGIGTGAGGTNLSIALFRQGATAAIPAQIRAAATDEAKLYEPNAKCLLPGSNVSALSYDDSTDLLHVATTAGSARMRGLLVVDKDATVYTGIDAKNGAVATRDSGSADITMPAVGLREAAVAGIGHNGGPPLYDPDEFEIGPVSTSNATPLAVPVRPLNKGESRNYVIELRGKKYDDDSVYASYRIAFRASRPGEGNIAVYGTPSITTLARSSGSWTEPTVTANTTAQAPNINLAGLASTNMEWMIVGSAR